MKKGEGGTIGVGKRGGGSPMENRNGGVPFNDSFHRPGDQSLTKNIYFPRQLNGYHMVSKILPFFTTNKKCQLKCRKSSIFRIIIANIMIFQSGKSISTIFR